MTLTRSERQELDELRDEFEEMRREVKEVRELLIRIKGIVTGIAWGVAIGGFLFGLWTFKDVLGIIK
jgi:hypothetical protein